jgi:hypothetical protein
MVNKKISNSRRVNGLPLGAALLFTWLIPHLDVNGAFYGSAVMVKSLVLPRQKCTAGNVETYLRLMEKAKNDDGKPLIYRYRKDGEVYLVMPGFKDEQPGLRTDRERPEFPLPPPIPQPSGENPADNPPKSSISEVKSSEVNRNISEQNSRAREALSEMPTGEGEQKALTSAVEVEKNTPPQVTDFKNLFDITDLTTRLTDSLTTETRGPNWRMQILKKAWQDVQSIEMSQEVFIAVRNELVIDKVPMPLFSLCFAKLLKYGSGKRNLATYFQSILKEKCSGKNGAAASSDPAPPGST